MSSKHRSTEELRSFVVESKPNRDKSPQQETPGLKDSAAFPLYGTNPSNNVNSQ